MKERDILGNLDVDWRIIFKQILNKYDNVDWIPLAQNRDPWRDLVNTLNGPLDSIKC
jgi:hypothetical protein